MNTPVPLTLNQFDLLPPSFRYRNRVRQILCSWITIVCMLLAILCGVIAATTFSIHRDHRMNEQIASTAIPLIDLRRDVIKLQDENNQRKQWCEWVETTRPDDSALQTLAAIAVASQNGTQEAIIDSLHLRLPIEYPISAAQTPSWAVPRIAISARITTDQAVQPWIDRLNSIDRIEAAAAVADSNMPAGKRIESSDIGRVQLTATPLATRVLP